MQLIGVVKALDNEVYIDLQETISLQVSSTGQILRSEITGKVMMKSLLSGMPECKFGLNDKLSMDQENTGGNNANRQAAYGGVVLDDCSFHRYVEFHISHLL